MSHTVNFLHEVEAPKRHRAHQRKKAVRAAVLAALGIVALWLVVVLFAAGQVIAAALDGKDALYRARDSAVALDFDGASVDLAVADDKFSSAEKGLGLLRTAEIIPWVSTQIRAADTLVTSGREVIGALQTAVDLGGELVRLSGFTTDELQQMAAGTSPRATFDDLSSETKRAMLERLAGSSSDLQLLAARISIARSELSTIDRSGLLGPVADALGPLDAKLAEGQTVVKTLAIASELLPEFAGLGKERTHLLLFLNNTELRPGGGFIGTYGILKTKDGDVTELETADSYALDRPSEGIATAASPAPLARYNATPIWYFRDANWSPDFSASSADALRMFNQEVAVAGGTPQSFDGTLGVTPTFLQSLLGITGPIAVGGQTFTADNVTDDLEYQVEVGYKGQDIPPEQRKEVIGAFVNELKRKMFSLPLSEWIRVADAVQEGFAKKQIVMMSADAKTEDLIASVGWGGRIVAPPSGGDAQMVVDANIASLKTDPKVARAIAYEIFKNSSGQYVGRTTVTYSHTGSFDWKTSRYRTYTRLYVPAGSELIRVTGSMLDDKIHNPTGSEGPVDVSTEFGMTSFGTFVSIEPGETRSLAFEYKLSDAVVASMNAGTYKLSEIKQIGAQDNGLTLTLGFGKNVASASVPEAREDWGDQTYHLVTKLDRDLQFIVGF
ncbi:MAG: DUF4012 domain-containing protein [Candidatus Uhrbacteria bacterium]